MRGLESFCVCCRVGFFPSSSFPPSLPLRLALPPPDMRTSLRSLAAGAAAAMLLCAGTAPAPAAADCPGWSPDMGVVRDMLSTLMEALDEASVPYWVNYGTLLGAIREGDIIDGDDDADLGMEERHLDKVWGSSSVHEALAGKGFKLVRSMNNDLKVYPVRSGCAGKKTTDAYFKNCCENVDIFFYKKDGRCMMRDCFNEWKEACPYPANNDLTLDSFPAYYIEKIVDYGGGGVSSNFGRSLRVPAHYNRYLAHAYGHDWRKPVKGRKHPGGGRKGCDPQGEKEEGEP